MIIMSEKTEAKKEEKKEHAHHKEAAKDEPKEAKHEHAKPAEAPKEAPKHEAKAEAPKEAPKAAAPAAAPASAEPRRRSKLAVIHVYSSKNDTIITATDVSGAETFAWASGGMIVKSDREEGRPYAAMQAAIKVVNALKEKGVMPVYIKIRAPGGNGSKTPGAGAQAVVRAIARMGVRLQRIEDVTPVPTDSMRKKGGRRGRRV